MSSISEDAAYGPDVGRDRLPLERLLSRSSLIAGGAVLLAVALAWWWLLVWDMPAMPMGGHAMAPIEPWTAAYLLPAFVMWAVMMVAMMLPSAAPMILLHARLERAPPGARRFAHSLLFVLAYLLVWTGFSAAAALAQALLIQLGLLSAMALALGDRIAAAAFLVLAALYQFSPAKTACLDQCRSPIHFVMRFWSPGAAGALRLGITHGLYCVGCCWGLMLLLFVAGVMNLAWVAFLAALVFVEKTAPRRWHADRAIGGVLLVTAVALIALPTG